MVVVVVVVVVVVYVVVLVVIRDVIFVVVVVVLVVGTESSVLLFAAFNPKYNPTDTAITTREPIITAGLIAFPIFLYFLNFLQLTIGDRGSALFTNNLNR